MIIKFDEWKKHFTLDEIERVKAHKEEIDPVEIDGILEVLAAGRETLKIALTWGYNRRNPENTYFGDGIEICVNVWFYDKFTSEVQNVQCGLWDICQICDSDDRKRCGYIRTYTEN